MLQLKKICKEYSNTGTDVVALKDITVAFRSAEFVSILGPSGGGKTTLLNIIGGLDKYNSGDLYINGVSTREFKDADWDDYRNHRIGFVFQSYNLIPHQSVLSNVELALTLSGVGRTARRKRAIEALEKVGLGDCIDKLPSQLSGGQMQRVAIARALVNNPDIILADEPTGALDSKNSIQIMELLKDISVDRLVIMVTHNPELAIEYSTRIIKFNDGQILEDSMPFKDDTPLREPNSKNIAKLPWRQRVFSLQERKKSKMSFKTALYLSMKNLYTKKARTALTSIAASIGIFGIAIVLSLSSGFQTYIDKVQQDTLILYPLVVSKSTADFSNVLEVLGSGDQKGQEGENLQVNQVISHLVSQMSKTNSANSLVEFKKEFLKELETNEELNKAVSSIQYDYGAYINIYDEKHNSINPSNFINSLINEVYTIYSNGESNGEEVVKTLSKGISTLEGYLFSEMIDNKNIIESQYTLVDGEWPWESKLYPTYDESEKIVLVVDSNYCIPDYRMYELGFSDNTSVHDVAMSIVDPTNHQLNNSKVDIKNVLGKKYSALYKYEYYKLNSDSTYSKLNTEEINAALDDDSKGLNAYICGIVKEKSTQDMVSTRNGSLMYSSKLMKKYLDKCSKSDIVQKQLENKEINVLTGKTYASEEREYTRVDLIKYLNEFANENIGYSDKYDYGTTIVTNIETNIINNKDEYLSKIKDQVIVNLILKKYNISSLNDLTNEQAKNEVMWLMCNTEKYFVSFKTMLDSNNIASSFENTKSLIGIYDEESLKEVKIYCSSFPKKDNLIKYINEYNATKEDSAITYQDYIGLIMSSISTIVGGLSMVLIGFVSVSLVVSCIMIGIVTYISVFERKKEIGVLRAMGASRGNIVQVFNSETLIIGAISGGIGVVLTIVLDIPINAIINTYVNVGEVAILPWWGAVGLIGLSIILTFISGLIPSQIASQKDPVECLRGE